MRGMWRSVKIELNFQASLPYLLSSLQLEFLAHRKFKDVLNFFLFEADIAWKMEKEHFFHHKKPSKHGFLLSFIAAVDFSLWIFHEQHSSPQQATKWGKENLRNHNDAKIKSLFTEKKIWICEKKIFYKNKKKEEKESPFGGNVDGFPLNSWQKYSHFSSRWTSLHTIQSSSASATQHSLSLPFHISFFKYFMKNIFIPLDFMPDFSSHSSSSSTISTPSSSHREVENLHQHKLEREKFP